MPSAETQLADFLEQNIAGLASTAARQLVRRREGVPEAGGAAGTERWIAHYAQRLRELTVSLHFDEPDLFLSELAWSRTAFQYRATSIDELQSSLDCLRDTLRVEVPPELRDLATRWTDRTIERLSTIEIEAPTFGSCAEDRLALSYLESLLEGDRHRAIRLVLRAVDNGLSVDDACEKVLLPAQRHVGVMWHRDEVIVAQEHFITETTSSLLTMLSTRAPMPDANGCTLMLCTVQGNAHDLGTRFIADAFARAGWNVILLGADLPRREIVLGAEIFAPDVLGLSASLAVHLTNLAATIRAVRLDQPAIKILVGGRVFRRAPSLTAKIGADGAAGGAREALEVAADLVGLALSDAPSSSTPSGPR